MGSPPPVTATFALAERNVPRYTSYPTAPHFSAAVTPALYRQWLEALPRSASRQTVATRCYRATIGLSEGRFGSF